jgi:hypothetical protein
MSVAYLSVLDRLIGAQPDASGWKLDHDRQVFERSRAIVRPDFSPTKWESFRRFAADGLSAARVAAEMGLRKRGHSGQVANFETFTTGSRRASRWVVRAAAG